MLRTIAVLIVCLFIVSQVESQGKKKSLGQKSPPVRYATFIIPDLLIGQMGALQSDEFKADLKKAGFIWRIRTNQKMEAYLERFAGTLGTPAVIVSDENNRVYVEQSKGEITGDPGEVLKLLKIKK